jgi:hypothetical protein
VERDSLYLYPDVYQLSGPSRLDDAVAALLAAGFPAPSINHQALEARVPAQRLQAAALSLDEITYAASFEVPLAP